MRIGLITPGFSASEEDWCIPALLDLVRVLSRREDVTVFTLRYPHHRRSYRVHDAAVHAFGGGQRGGVARLPLLLRAYRRIVAEARRRPFDVLHALFAHEPGFLAVRAGRSTGTPTLVSVLGGELVDLPETGYGGQRSPANRWLVRRALAGALRVSVGSRSLERLAAGHAAAEKLVRLPLGFEPRRFRSGETPADGPRLGGEPKLLYVGSLVPVKDQATLLRAFARLTGRLPGAGLHLVGEGPLRPRLEGLVRELGVADRVSFHGAVAHDRLAGYYRQADLLAVSSRFESQGMVALEAAACGCPVAGTAVGVLPEICPSEATCEPGQAEALARILGAALDAAGGERLRAGQAAAVREFELPTTLERLRHCYAGLAR